jgi:hypothetical protein
VGLRTFAERTRNVSGNVDRVLNDVPTYVSVKVCRECNQWCNEILWNESSLRRKMRVFEQCETVRQGTQSLHMSIRHSLCLDGTCFCGAIQRSGIYPTQNDFIPPGVNAVIYEDVSRIAGHGEAKLRSW